MEVQSKNPAAGLLNEIEALLSDESWNTDANEQASFEDQGTASEMDPKKRKSMEVEERQKEPDADASHPELKKRKVEEAPSTKETAAVPNIASLSASLSVGSSAGQQTAMTPAPSPAKPAPDAKLTREKGATTKKNTKITPKNTSTSKGKQKQLPPNKSAPPSVNIIIVYLILF